SRVRDLTALSFLGDVPMCPPLSDFVDTALCRDLSLLGGQITIRLTAVAGVTGSTSAAAAVRGGLVLCPTTSTHPRRAKIRG
ncbi:hypothetical protein, partial [Mycobacterium sp.]|uniref:hypothetical protein n=1 Tax=Mycobacterium sp. TaxID=1785 RepID=UPI003BAE66DD